MSWPNVIQALVILIGAGHISPTVLTKEDGKRREKAKLFNLAIMTKSLVGGEFQVLASPVTGSGVQVDRITQLFLLAQTKKESDPVLFVWQTLLSNGQRMMKEGRAIETEEENVKEISQRFKLYQDEQLPLLRHLGIC